jgi:hypothetical protein
MNLLELGYEVVDFCRGQLGVPDEVYIDLQVIDLKEDGVVGWAFESGEDGEYEIEVEETLELKELITTICHEMVHVKQLFERRELNEDEAYGNEDILAEGFSNYESVF